jgi:predicted class III extradiol MEMO1 family dioxygenase
VHGLIIIKYAYYFPSRQQELVLLGPDHKVSNDILQVSVIHFDQFKIELGIVKAHFGEGDQVLGADVRQRRSWA